MLVAENSSSTGKRLAVVGLGLGEFSLMPKQHASCVDRFQCVRVLVTEETAPDLQGFDPGRFNPIDQADGPLRLRHGL